MSLIEAFILGLLQGLTEFLPVSSSAHLKLAKLFFNLDHSENQVIFDLMCHFGTLLALILFLKKDLLYILRTDSRQLFLLLFAIIPLIPCYFLLKPLRDAASQPQCLGLWLIMTAVILICGQKWKLRPMSSSKRFSDAIWIGAWQSIALIPGISRSASTISCARILGWEASEAVRFSFLLSIPTIIGGNCLELLKIALSDQTLPSISFPACAVGLLTSFVFGSAVIRFALSYLEKGNLTPFAWYCFGFGAFVTIYLNFF